MSWNPIAARAVLDSLTELRFVREVKKLSGFQCSQSGRELALNEENKSKVSIYVSVAPHNMPGVSVEETYEPSAARLGRHADLEGLVPSLGFAYPAALVQVESADALNSLINWYRYA